MRRKLALNGGQRSGDMLKRKFHFMDNQADQGRKGI